MLVKKTTKKITNVQKIPMDREITKNLGEFFGRSIINITPNDDEKKLTYSIRKNERVQLDYEFNKETIQKIKAQLGRDDEETQLNVGRLAGKFWLSLIVLAYEQRQNEYEIKGKFKYQDIVNLWGVSEGSKLYSDIRNLFISLSSAKFIQKTHEKNETKVRFYSLINTGEIVEKKDEAQATTFSFFLNPEALGLTADWIRYGRLSKSYQDEGYLSLPLDDLKNSIKDVNYINFRERLRLFGGSVISIGVILEEWIKITNPDKLKRKNYCITMVNNFLSKAKKENELKDFTLKTATGKNWRYEFQINISK
jgi:hypothetical protein